MLKILCHMTQHVNIKSVVDRFLSIDTTGLYCSFMIQPCDLKQVPNTGLITPDGRINIIDKMERARKIALVCEYDYLFNVEHDNLIPKNALIKLLAHHKDVVSGIYRFRPSRTSKVSLMYRPISSDKKEDGLVRADLVPWGCTLFSRKALTKVPFKVGLDGDYSEDCKKAGIKQYVDFDVKVGHVDYEREMKIVWP